MFLSYSGAVSPHSWQDTTPSKSDRWRKMSWAAGEQSSGASTPAVVASPPRHRPTAFYNYQKPLTARPARTLVEVPLQKKVQTDVSSYESGYSGGLNNNNNPINIFQSSLDPNSRPFTPAGFSSTSSQHSCSRSSSRYDLISPNPVRETMSREKNDCSMRDSGAGALLAHTDLEDISDIVSFSDYPSERSLCMSNTSGLESISSSSRLLEASKLSEDPLPDDPNMLLPQLDTSQDDVREDVSRRVTPTPSSSQPRFSLMGSDSSSLPPPVFPFATWSGRSKPPLLPTPDNFPPFGPRQPKQMNLFEEDLSSSAKRPAHQALAKLPADLSRLQQDLSSTIRKPGRPSSFSQTNHNNNNLMKSDDVKWGPSSLAAGWLENLSSSARNIIRDSSSKIEEWGPETGLVSGSLIESYPVPEEYMVL